MRGEEGRGKEEASTASIDDQARWRRRRRKKSRRRLGSGARRLGLKTLTAGLI
jgi:hypothetical protein